MDYSKQKIFSIHFPDKKVYIENTCKSLYDKMDYIKNDKDHVLYSILKEYPNPEIVVECYRDGNYDIKKTIVNKYIKDSYKILNVNLFPPSKYNLFQSLYKWMGY